MAALLAERVRRHVSPTFGITNDALRQLALLSAGGRVEFDGLYSADDVPAGLSSRSTFLIIVNLARRRGGAGHFVALVGKPDVVFYLDPYGHPCRQPDVRRFLRDCYRPIAANDTQVQSLRSVYCGFYALLFALYLGLPRRPGFKLRFHTATGDLPKNDALCMDYLRRIV